MKQPFSTWLVDQWYHNGPWQIVLRPFSWLFGLLSLLRRQAYRLGVFKSHKLPVPVIVVGNISVGGTGKTPFVIWLVEQLQEQGWRPGIVSRGYGGSASHTQRVDDNSLPQVVGDEPSLLAQRTGVPVFVGRKRARTARHLLRQFPLCNLIISDDGLQHYALQRDVEIVIVDGEREFGNAQLLPAGPLRESPARLTRVDAVVFNGGAPAAGAYLMQMAPGPFHNLQDPMQRVSVDAFAGKRIHAVAGIGNPQRFFNQLALMGLHVEPHSFPDHHEFTVTDLQFAVDDVILMTEKDAVKCVLFAQANWWFLPVSAVIDHALTDKIGSKLASYNLKKD
ncbi:tetraacyldisaccharide 4'-kinase [Methylobacillus gramineus]|uniref:tetraacyldisaccharide 4'-kinase n=1 Tax=Methylobacillus gramineus TaxID=755169 RepID=UPI001CFFC054|nr:tetraacyldisaccharide 4'-kinase [Methylobacillus gramineus]MCB5186381.1 tetraacyldisaccharide 4'-kinase [Methylobacillus gramineus]